jgi:hypothetical protein
MKWIETIEIRAKHNSKELLESQLRNFLDEIQENEKGQTIRVLSRMNLDTDYLVLLWNDAAQVKQDGSPLGHQLVSFLKDFGMVNHSVWSEI